MAACTHRRLVYVPLEDRPEIMAEVCLDCHATIGTSGPDDPELREIGGSLGDPDPRSNPADPRGRRLAREARHTGTPEDLARDALERQRRGEQVLPWELLPVGWVLYKAWQLGPDAKVEAVGPSGSVERFYVMEHPFPVSLYPVNRHTYFYEVMAGMGGHLVEALRVDQQTAAWMYDQNNRAIHQVAAPDRTPPQRGSPTHFGEQAQMRSVPPFYWPERDPTTPETSGHAAASAIVVPATRGNPGLWQSAPWETVLVASRRWNPRLQDDQPKTTRQDLVDSDRSILYAGAFSKARIMKQDRSKKGRLTWKNNPVDPRARKLIREARHSGAPEDLVRAAHERQRRGEDVAPWELVPISYTFLEGWRLGKEGRIEAFRNPAFTSLPGYLGRSATPPEPKPDRFYAAPSSYPMVEPGLVGYTHHHAEAAERADHMGALAKWRDLGAVVIKLDFSETIAGHLADDHGSATYHNTLTPDGLCDYCRWIEDYSWRVLVMEKNVCTAMNKAGFHGGHNEPVLLPEQWDWARIMKKKGKRWRNPADPRRRRAERGGAGGVQEIVRILQERIRAGQLDEWALWHAEFLSRPFDSVSIGDIYRIYPFRSGAGLDLFKNDPRTSQLNAALRGILGPRAMRGPSGPNEPPFYEALEEAGYVVLDSTDIGPDMPPWVVWAEEDMDEEEAQEALVDDYVRRGPSWELDSIPDPAVFDGTDRDIERQRAARWHLRTRAFEHAEWAVNLLEWLRRFSTAEYMTVLGGWPVCESWPPPGTLRRLVEDYGRYPPWQQVELDLVRSFLGGPPL